MLVHVLGWLTVAAQVGLGGWLTYYLFNAGKESRTWLIPPKAPEFAGGALELSSSSDYVGFV